MQIECIIFDVDSENEEDIEGSEEESTEKGGNIKFDANVIGSSEKSKSSLEDIYGMSVFSNEFDEKINIENKIKTERYNDIFNNIFKNERKSDVDYIFQCVMESNDVRHVTSDYYNSDTGLNNFLYSACYIAVGMFFTTIIILIINKMKRNRKYENNSYNN